MKLEEEVEAIAPKLLRYCLARLGDRGLAEEVSQEALAALVQRWRRHGRPDSPAAFTFTVARRRAGRAAWRRRLWAPWKEESTNGHRPSSVAPDAIYVPRERLRNTVAALAELPRRQREALLLVAVGELSTAEVARIQSVSRSAVKMRVLRARRRLENLLDPKKGP